jgi:hypothetical protein
MPKDNRDEFFEKVVKALEKEISDHERAICDIERKINEYFIEYGGDYANSYVEYFDGNKYHFMFVERQSQGVHNGECYLRLDGPTIVLYDNPLSGELGEDGSVVGEYDELGSVMVPAIVFQSVSSGSIKRINKSEMDQVINAWEGSMKTRMKLV